MHDAQQQNTTSRSSCLLQQLPRFVIARHILRFLPFQEVLHLQEVCDAFQGAVNTACWSDRLETVSDDWNNDQTRKWILRVLPHVRSLVVYGAIDASSPGVLHDFYRVRSSHLFQCLEELQDSGTLLEAFRTVWQQWVFPRLRRLVLTLGDIHAPRALGRLVSEGMPLLKQLDIPWGFPEFSDGTAPVVLNRLTLPRGWSLHEVAGRLGSLPQGSSIQELSVTHSIAATLTSDVAALRQRLLNPSLKISIYNLHVELPAEPALWDLLNTGMITFETCSFGMDGASSPGYPEASQPFILPELKRLELRNLDPDRHHAVFKRFKFLRIPHLVFLRGSHSTEQQPSMARLFRQHPDFQRQFRIAFDVYDAETKATIRSVWLQHCPNAYIL